MRVVGACLSLLAGASGLQVAVPHVSCGTIHRCRTTSMLTEQEERVSAAMEIKEVDSVSARATGLALALDDGTRKSHSVAENTAFVTGFFRGIATRTAFAELVSSLYFVYEAMEAAFDATEDPRVKALDYPELRRLGPLEDDMEYYFGSQWRSEVSPSPATQEYVARVHEVAADQPQLLIAHMYTRYLGDLFGGQMMGSMARRSLSLDLGKGTTFYEFEEIPKSEVKPFIEAWYSQLNKVQLELTPEQQQEIVDEGNLVFALNIKVFDALSGNPLRAVWALIKASLKKQFSPSANGQ